MFDNRPSVRNDRDKNLIIKNNKSRSNSGSKDRNKRERDSNSNTLNKTNQCITKTRNSSKNHDEHKKLYLKIAVLEEQLRTMATYDKANNVPVPNYNENQHPN